MSAIQYDPDQSEYYYGLGRGLLEKKSFVEAHSAFESAIQDVLLNQAGAEAE